MVFQRRVKNQGVGSHLRPPNSIQNLRPIRCDDQRAEVVSQSRRHRHCLNERSELSDRLTERPLRENRPLGRFAKPDNCYCN